ncbi:signal peptidase II [Ralstonia sp. UBA689]|uniref:signal peptidase II n=1 Tax=Ralstonia sp. UBA689 TaxID=1947373 RepID=UPI0025E31FB9|nr:signal peptidase II [Ralstonia sp. UBA689]
MATTRATRNNGRSKAVSRSSSGHGLGPWLGLAVIWILLDQLTKVAILKTFTYGESRPITGFFNLVLAYNRGAAFSFLAAAGGWQRWFFTGLGVAAALFIVWLLRRHSGQKLFCFALALILGGALGNVIDRLIYGHVVDFLDFYLRGYHWPAFNVADCGITIGAVLLIVDELRRVRR